MTGPTWDVLSSDERPSSLGRALSLTDGLSSADRMLFWRYGPKAEEGDWLLNPSDAADELTGLALRGVGSVNMN